MSSHEPIAEHLEKLLSNRAHPKTICPSEVARALTASELDFYQAQSWRDVMDDIRRMVFEKRDCGELVVLQRGQVIASETGLDDIKGPIRIRKHK